MVVNFHKVSGAFKSLVIVWIFEICVILMHDSMECVYPGEREIETKWPDSYDHINQLSCCLSSNKC